MDIALHVSLLKVKLTDLDLLSYGSSPHSSNVDYQDLLFKTAEINLKDKLEDQFPSHISSIDSNPREETENKKFTRYVLPNGEVLFYKKATKADLTKITHSVNFERLNGRWK
jgi:hypothetical protein